MIALLAWRWYVIGGAFALLLTWGGAQTWRLDLRTKALAEERTARAADGARASEAARLQSEAFRERERRTAISHTETDLDGAKKSLAALDAAAARGAADQRLLQRYRAALAAYGEAARNPATAASGPAADAAFDLLADLQRRLGQAAGQLAAEADRRGIAGQRCERKYDALTQ